ncbi:MAG: hypothetical protein NTZ74_09235 [Chloroflexi bacterium]|nr:hypothetical protein [Chloroflexota bacterium]
MKYPLNVGDSFTITDTNGTHLNFIVADADSSPNTGGMIMLLYMSSSTGVYKDPTTIIKFGEHPFVDQKKEESWIKYQNPLFFTRNELDDLVVDYYGPISEELLTRIQTGIKSSILCAKRDKKTFNEWHQDRLLRN